MGDSVNRKSWTKMQCFYYISTHFLLLVFCESGPLNILYRHAAFFPVISLRGYSVSTSPPLLPGKTQYLLLATPSCELPKQATPAYSERL